MTKGDITATPDRGSAASITKVDYVETVVPGADKEHDVWGNLDEGEGPNYRGLGWIRTSVLLVKIQIGLGVLAIPANLAVFGVGPGLVVVFVIGILTTWTDYIVGTFKLAHPEVYTLADVGQIMGGPILRETLGIMYWLYMTFVAGAGMLGCSTAFNALSEHGACTAVFVLVSAVISFGVASIQTLDRISWLTWVGIVGLMSGILTVTVAVGVQDRPSDAPATGPWSPGVVAVGSPSFTDAAAALASIIFSYAGAPGFFNIVSEMKDPRKYTRSLICCQALVMGTYMIVGAVVYHYCGQYVSSPALGSAGPLLKKISYGLALPGLIIGTVLNVHLPAKYLFVRILSGTQHLARNTRTHYLVWFGVVFLNTSVSFLVAEAIPVFGDLLSLIGAALATPLAMTIEGVMFIYEERRLRKPLTPAKIALHIFNGFMLIVSVFAMCAGWYASVTGIIKSVSAGGTSSPFSCADNSNSVPK